MCSRLSFKKKNYYTTTTKINPSKEGSELYVLATSDELTKAYKKTLENIAYDFDIKINIVKITKKNKKELTKMRWKMIGLGSIMDVIEIGTIILWIKTGIWWPFAVGMCIVVAIGVFISRYYYKSVNYICPQCHTVFKPKFGEMFWAKHTPNTRKLTCTCCGHKGFCVETYAQGEKES